MIEASLDRVPKMPDAAAPVRAWRAPRSSQCPGVEGELCPGRGKEAQGEAPIGGASCRGPAKEIDAGDTQRQKRRRERYRPRKGPGRLIIQINDHAGAEPPGEENEQERRAVAGHNRSPVTRREQGAHAPAARYVRPEACRCARTSGRLGPQVQET